MKKFATTLLFIASLVATAQAAVTVGFDAGYLVDSEEEFLALRVGTEVGNAQSFSHLLELELGYTDTKESGLKSEILPLFANYRFVAAAERPWGWYAGLGAGVARSTIKGRVGAVSVDVSDESFAAQTFAGVSYRLSEAAALTLGVRYLWIDDVDFGFGSLKVDDDLALSAGFNFRF